MSHINVVITLTNFTSVTECCASPLDALGVAGGEGAEADGCCLAAAAAPAVLLV